MKIFAREAGATMQVAGGTPAMCDGVTRASRAGPILFSRSSRVDCRRLVPGIGSIAMLGICDKIVRAC